MKRAAWILLTPLAIFLVLSVAVKFYIGPKLEAWVLREVKSYSEQNLPVVIEAEGLEVYFLKPSVSIEKIHLIPRGELAEGLSDVLIDRTRLRIDLFQLLGGRLQLPAVVVEGVSGNIQLDPFMKDDSPAKELPLEMIFNLADKIPLQRIFIRSLHLNLESKKQSFKASIDDAGLLVTNMGRNITGKINIPQATLAYKDMGPFQVSFDTHLVLTRQSLRILQAGLRMQDSELLARGEFTNFKDILISPQGVLNLSTKSRLDNIYEQLKKVMPNTKLPVMSGEFTADIDGQFKGAKQFSGKIELTTKEVRLDNFDLGNAEVSGKFVNRKLTLSDVNVAHPAGKAKLLQSEIELENNFSFKAKAQVEELDLQRLFASLDLKNIPVGVGLQGVLPCEGELKNLTVKCTGVTLTGKDLWVKADSTPQGFPVINVKELKANGSVEVSPKAVSYKANLSIADNTGTTDGVITFADGFNINYATKNLDFKNIENFAKLHFSGSAALEGNTKGDSHAAIFDMKVNTKDFVFEGFRLGNLFSDLKYRKGHLIFEDVAGIMQKTQYLGGVDVNLNNNTLSGEVSAPTTDLVDIAKIIEGFFRIPFYMQGTGTAKASFSGPLDFWKMNYKVESSFKKGTIVTESFDKLIFNVVSENGNLQMTKVNLQKNSSTIAVTGGISSAQEMNILADGKGWKLEESEGLGKVSNSILGNLVFSSEVKGTVKAPHLLVKGSITDTSLEDQEVPDSHFNLNMDRNSLSGKVSMYGDKVLGQFQIPFEKGSAPLLIKMSTTNWNYTTMLALLGGANLLGEYESSLTSRIDLRSDSGDILKATGKITVDNFFLKRGNFNLHNKRPIEITAENGVGNIKNFELEGPASRVQIRGENFDANDLSLSVNANLDLRLLQIFLPFLEDLGGPINVATTISGPLAKPQILGTAKLDNAFVKIKGFPHPLEKIESDVVFSQSRIIINSIRGQIGGGTLRGDGSVTINGLKDLPTSIRGRLENVTFNVPDKVRTSGNADILFSGRWFPFTLSGTYHVSSALVEMEFGDNTTINGVRQSVYLPKAIRENRFEPVILDLQILMDKNIIVKNSLINGSVTGNLQVKGPPSSPVLLGRISTEKKTDLIFKDKLFEVITGNIEFNDPSEINPNIYISAQARVNEYDINVLAQGPSKNLDIRLTSIPPLSEPDIISLIALGVTSSQLDQSQSRNQATQTGFEIGAATIAKPISKTLEGTLGLNLQFSSEFDTARNISVPKVTLSRNISEKLKASGSRPVGDTESYDVKLEYKLNNNITAIGSYESRGAEENSSLSGTQRESVSVFGLDLEFKREFK
jgi:translocation and assembly module TamB